MINNLAIPNIRIFVFGTLRIGERLDYYMEGSSPLGLYYTMGQLMESTSGGAYIEFSDKNAATIGELYNVNYSCLLRINHLESTSGEFPKGYDLDILPVWPYVEDEPCLFNEDQKILALFYKRRNSPKKIKSGSWVKRKTPIDEIKKILYNENQKIIYPKDVLNSLVEYLGYRE